MIHGKTAIDGKKTPEYMAWLDMKRRANNPRRHKYSIYGGIGVSVFPEWEMSFMSFYNHVGDHPSPNHSLDRFPDPYGNYEPGNVRWATREEQARNKRNTKRLTYNGVTLTVKEWAAKLQIPYNRIMLRHP
jgi:hypothetical protein